MDVSELRKQILRAIDEARKDVAGRRTVLDASRKAYDEFLTVAASPLFKQAAAVLTAENHPFVVHTPSETIRLVSENSPETFLEMGLDTSTPEPSVIGRVSLTRGRQGVIVEERPIAPGTDVAALKEADVSAFLIAEIPKLILKP